MFIRRTAFPVGGKCGRGTSRDRPRALICDIINGQDIIPPDTAVVGVGIVNETNVGGHMPTRDLKEILQTSQSKAIQILETITR